jgi:hypothetical protein
MEENVATSSGSPRTPIMTATGGGIVPPPPPPPVRTTTVPTPTTSGSGSIPSTDFNHCSLHSECMTGAPFSYGMPGFDSNSVLTYSTLQTMGLGAGSSNAPLQGSVMGTTAPFNAIPYGGGHIPPPSPSLGGMFQQSIGPNANYSFFSGGSLGPSSYMMLVGSMSFSLFGAFGNNIFLRLLSRLGETPTLVNKTLCKVPFLHRE